MSNIIQSVSVAEYILNISVPDRNEQRLTGSVEFQFKILNNTKTVALYAGSHLQIVVDHQILAFKCATDNNG